MFNLIDKKFGRLIVIRQAGKDKWGYYKWLCKCECGQKIIISGGSLKSGNSKTCGCSRKNINIKHGHARRGAVSEIYRIWISMIQRCINPNHPNYCYYGDRGISVCERWKRFPNFLEDIGKRPSKNHSIDRINNNGNYCKSNCHWATWDEQSRNTHRNKLVTFYGKTQCLVDWAKEIRINYRTLHNRIYRLHWSTEKAFVSQVRQRKKKEGK